ncbi:MAG: hypothetical protein HC884_08830 [Chloroflexaceae bacterium]|nr:hypothetical protein [Chloroflexaceae bacterium]
MEKICGEIDRLRQERKFPEASDLCRRAMGEETEGPAWSLNRTRTYLSRHPVGNQSLLSGLSRMLNDCLEQQRRDIAADYAEAEMILERLQDFQEEYELLWWRFSNALDSYLRLQRRAQIPLIGSWLRRGRGLEEALEGARQIYRECYALCPRDANLLAQRGLLGVEDRSETLRPLSEGTEAKKGTSSW